jgi:hypothetical protein
VAIESEDGGGTTCRGQQAEQQPQGRRLPGTVRAEDADDLTSANDEFRSRLDDSKVFRQP